MSEEWFRGLFGVMFEGVAAVDRGKVSEANRAFASMFGYEPSEVVGKPLSDFVSPESRDLVRRNTSSGSEESYEAVGLKKDGTTLNVEIRGRTLSYRNRAVHVAAIRDITERKRAEEALREAEELFRSAFDNAPIGMTLSDLEGRYLRVNPALCEILGYSEEELQGKTFQALTHPEDYEVSMAYVNRVLKGEIDKYNLEKRYIRADGNPVWVSLSASLGRTSEDRPLYFIGQVQDITERKRAEERLQEANRRLEEVAVLKADFTAMVAHELGTPLAVIRGYADMLAMDKLGPANRSRALAQIQAQTEVLGALIADMRVAAAIERDDFIVKLRQVSSGELLDDAAQFAGTLLGDRPFSTRTAVDEQVLVDPYRIGQVLRNLLSNAAKYSPDGTPVELRAVPGETAGRVRIEAADRGYGVHFDDVERIFEKFGRGRDRSGRKVVGAGLGLYLSRRILRAHGSELRFRPAPGGGSVFFFELEVAR